MGQLGSRVWTLGLVVMLAIALSGCVKSDVVLDIRSATGGVLVQQLEFSDRWLTLNPDAVHHWLKTVETQAAKVDGRVQERPSALTVAIPFSSTADLERKFNQFFPAILAAEGVAVGADHPAIAAALHIDHSNFLLMERDHLTLAVDLRSLGVTARSGEVLLSPAPLIRLQFQLNTPWGARNIVRAGALPTEIIRPRSLYGSKTLIWSLIPGEDNTLETIFWLPQPLGWGLLGILLVVGLGQLVHNARLLTPRAIAPPTQDHP